MKAIVRDFPQGAGIGRFDGGSDGVFCCDAVTITIEGTFPAA
jgi:hypothetical protein